MFLVLSCSCLSPINWNQVLSREWRWSWSPNTSERSKNFIAHIKNYIAHYGAAYIRSLTLYPSAVIHCPGGNGCCSVKKQRWRTRVNQPITPPRNDYIITTKAVRDCLIRPFDTISEQLVSHNSICCATYWVYKPAVKLKSQSTWTTRRKSIGVKGTPHMSVCTKWKTIEPVLFL